MFYFRRPFENGWKEYKLTKDEVKALADSSVDHRIVTLMKVKERMRTLGEKNKVTFSEAEVLAVYNGVEATYYDRAVDYISDGIAKKKAEAQKA